MIASAICIVALTAGCSTASRRAIWKEPATTATSRSATPASSALTSTPSPVATVTAACPLLSTGELRTLLGGANSQTKVTAVESAPDTNRDFASYECKYGSGSKRPFDLVVTAAKQDLSPQEGIDAIAKGNHVVIHKVTGVGEVGTFFTDSDGESLIAVAKVSHRETRTVIFSAPAVVPEQNFINLAKLVLDRV
jgi:hypothetical protein